MWLLAEAGLNELSGTGRTGCRHAGHRDHDGAETGPSGVPPHDGGSIGKDVLKEC